MPGRWIKPPSTEFEHAVHRVVRTVPRGRVISYGDVAWAVGRPGAARAVGTVMKFNPDTTRTPCHRVVRSDGTVGEYGGGPQGTTKKIRLLRTEGVPVGREGAIGGFEHVRWRPGRN